MTVLVGYSPHHEDVSALDLACQLARSDHTGVRALTVVPQGWPTPVAGDTDREFERWAEEEGSAAAAAATAYLREHDDVPSQAEWVAARSVPPALIEHARAVGVDRLLHSSPVPVVVTPRGYQAGPGSRVRRISLAFRGDDPTWHLLRQVAAIAQRTSADLRVVTFAVRGRPMYPRLVSGAEDMVLQGWVDTAHAEQSRARVHLAELGFPDPEMQVAVGRSWGAAMDNLDWQRGDILVVGSSSTHRLSRVFLGSSAAKILRHSPVPVVVVP